MNCLMCGRAMTLVNATSNQYVCVYCGYSAYLQANVSTPNSVPISVQVSNIEP